MSAPCPAFGFLVTMETRAALGAAARDRLSVAWRGFLATRGLTCSGGGEDVRTFVVRSEAAQATDTDRAAVRAWLASRDELRAAHVGDLIDLDQAV